MSKNNVNETRDVTYASRGDNASPVDTGNAHANRGADQSQGDSAPAAIATKEAGPVATGDAQANRKADVKKKSALIKEMLAVISTMGADEIQANITSLTTEGAVIEEPASTVIKEDLVEVFASAGLSEDFQDKALIIFEAAVGAKLASREAELVEQYEVKLAEDVATARAELEENVDKYLTFVAEEWSRDNVVAIEKGIQLELAESFLGGLKTLFVEHYVDVPNEKIDVVEALTAEVQAHEEKLNEANKTIIAATTLIEGFKAKEVVASLTEGLSAPQRDRFEALAENIKFENLEDYTSKITVIKESVAAPIASAPSAAAPTDGDNGLNEAVVIEEGKTKKNVLPVHHSVWTD